MQSGANRSPGEIPVNREKYRDFSDALSFNDLAHPAIRLDIGDLSHHALSNAQIKQGIVCGLSGN